MIGTEGFGWSARVARRRRVPKWALWALWASFGTVLLVLVL